MLSIRVAFLLLSMLTYADATRATPTDLPTSGQLSAESPQAGEKVEPAWIRWMKPALLAFCVIIVAAKVVFWPGQSHARPATPEEAKASQERMLDTVSNIRMLQAMGRGDGDAIREEMKLLELRSIRRDNE